MSKRSAGYLRDPALAEGRVELKLIDSDTGRIKKTSIGKNALSPTNKVRVAYIAGQYLNDMKASPMGKTMIVGLDGIGEGLVAADTDKQRAVVLLNLENKVYTDNYIPLYDTDGTLMLEDTIIGWINACNDGGNNPYLGDNVPNAPKQSLKALGSMSEVRGWFETNKALGTITHVGILTGFGDAINMTPVYGGFSAWQCLARTLSNSFIIPPSISGITGVDEILVYNPTGDISMYKVNLATGIVTDTSLNLSSFGLDSEPTRVGGFRRIDDNHLACRFNSYFYILEFDSAGACTEKLKINLNTNNDILDGLFKLDNEAGYFYYARLLTVTSGAVKVVYYKINLTDYTYVDIAYTDNTFLGGLPINWGATLDNVIVLARGGNNFYVGNYYTGEVIITTSLSDVCGNIVGTMTLPGHGFSLFDTSFKSNMMSVGKPYRYQDIMLDGLQIKDDITDPTDISSTVSLSNKYLPWISYGYYSNWYNLYPLSSPIEKTSSDTLDLSYAIGYKE